MLSLGRRFSGYPIRLIKGSKRYQRHKPSCQKAGQGHSLEQGQNRQDKPPEHRLSKTTRTTAPAGEMFRKTASDVGWPFQAPTTPQQRFCYATSWVQCEQRLAASGISLRHSGHTLVVG